MPQEQHIKVMVTSGVVFYAPNFAKTDDKDEPPLVQAEYIERLPYGELQAFGTLRSDDDSVDMQVYSGMTDLIVDVRAQIHDEPRLQHLIGARVRKGHIDRIDVDGERNSICCHVCSPGKADGVQISLDQAIKEMLEFEVHRRNADLAKYQRAICSNMMRSQRSRYLGLDQ
jgi:hypothetical protein